MLKVDDDTLDQALSAAVTCCGGCIQSALNPKFQTLNPKPSAEGGR